MRPLLLPGLLDAAAHNAARGTGDIGLFESAHVYAPAGPLDAPRAVRAEPSPPPSATTSAGLLTLAAPAGWRSPAPPGRLLRRQGPGGGARRRGRRRARGPAGRPAVPAPGPLGGRAHAWRRTSSAGSASCIRWWRGAWDLEGAAAFELDFDALSDEAQGPAAYRDLTTLPAVLQDIAVVAPDEVSAADVLALVREAGGELLASARVFDVYDGRAGGRGQPVAGAPARVPGP